MKINLIATGLFAILAAACTQTSETETSTTEVSTETTNAENISAERQAEIDKTTVEIEEKTEEVDSLINNL